MTALDREKFILKPLEAGVPIRRVIHNIDQLEGEYGAPQCVSKKNTPERRGGRYVS